MELKYIDANKPLNLFVLKQLKINSGKKNLCPLEEPVSLGRTCVPWKNLFLCPYLSGETMKNSLKKFLSGSFLVAICPSYYCTK
jgi:hypothetical protein